MALAGGALVLVGFVVLLRAGALPVWPDAEAMERVRWWTVLASGACYLVLLLLRAWRWRWLLEPIHPVPLARVISIAWIGQGATVVMPFRTGEVVRPALIRKKDELSGWAATGTIGAERIIDGLVLSVVLFVALRAAEPLDPLPRRIGELAVPVAVVPGTAYAALLIFVTAFVTMALFYWRRAWARRVTERVVGIASPRFASAVADTVERFASGFRFLPRWRHLVPYLVLTLGAWGFGAYGIWLLAYGCGFETISYTQACVALGVLALGILVPNAPGFFGAFQVSLYASLAMYFPKAQVVGPGSAFVFLLYVQHIGLTLLVAAIGLIIRVRGRSPSRPG